MSIFQKFFKKKKEELAAQPNLSPPPFRIDYFPKKDFFQRLADVAYAKMRQKHFSELNIISVACALTLLDTMRKEFLHSLEEWEEKMKEYLQLIPSLEEKRLDGAISGALAVCPFVCVTCSLVYLCFKFYAKKIKRVHWLKTAGNLAKKFKNTAYALAVPAQENHLSPRPIEPPPEQKEKTILDWIIGAEEKNIRHKELLPGDLEIKKKTWREMARETLEVYHELQKYPEWENHFLFFSNRLLEVATTPKEEKGKFPSLVAAMKIFGIFL